MNDNTNDINDTDIMITELKGSSIENQYDVQVCK